MDGVRVTTSSDLVFNGRYVAVGQCGVFQKLNYGMSKRAFTVNPFYKPRCAASIGLPEIFVYSVERSKCGQ